MEKSKLIDNYIYFTHLDRFCIIPVYPESMTDTLPSHFGTTNALSRTAPVFTYIDSGPRSVNIALILHRNMMDDVNKYVSNLKDNTVDFSGDDYVDTLIKYLQAAALPVYRNYSSSSKSVIPPMVIIRFGNEIFIKGVVNGGVTVQYQKPILSNNKYALVTVNFNVYETDPYDAESVVADGSFRGIVRSFKDGIHKSNYVGPNITTERSSVNNGLYKPKTIQSVSSSNNIGSSVLYNEQFKRERRVVTKEPIKANEDFRVSSKQSQLKKQSDRRLNETKELLNKLTQKKLPTYTGNKIIF